MAYESDILLRKALIMFNWLTPLTSILATQNDELDFSEKGRNKETSRPLLHTFLHAPPPALLDLVNGLSDDIYAFSRYAPFEALNAYLTVQ